jgi:hypothetical protein
MCGRCIGLTILSQSVRRLSRQCGILNISQPYRPPRPVNGDSFYFYLFIWKFFLAAELLLCLGYYLLTTRHIGARKLLALRGVT